MSADLEDPIDVDEAEDSADEALSDDVEIDSDDNVGDDTVVEEPTDKTDFATSKETRRRLEDYLAERALSRENDDYYDD